MSIVVDSSMTLPWYFVDESTARTEQVFDLVVKSGAIVPLHWRFEVANGFRMAMRRGRIDPAYRDASLTDLDQLPIEADHDSHAQAWADTVKLSDRHSLTIYDAAYLELALRRRLPLATLDQELIAAGTRENLAVL